MIEAQKDLELQIARILKNAGITAYSERASTLNVEEIPEFVTVKVMEQNITKSKRLYDDCIAFKANIHTIFTVTCDKDHVNGLDLDCMVIEEISKKHSIDIKSVKSVIGNKFNKYIVDTEIHDFEFVEVYMEDDE